MGTGAGRRCRRAARRGVAAGALTSLLLTACSAGAPATGAAEGAGNAVATPSSPSSAALGTAAGPAAPPTPSGTGTGPAPPPPRPRDGEPLDLPYRPGTELAVVGVKRGEVLFVRRQPGPEYGVAESLHPVAAGVVTSGRGWRTAAGEVWVEVLVDGVVGWALARHLGARAGTRDVTAEVVERLGARPVEASLQDLGLAVAQATASTDPPTLVVMSRGPDFVGSRLEVSYDVVRRADDPPAADDLLDGVRLRVVGQSVAGRTGYELVQVESTAYCAGGAPHVPGGPCP